MKFLVTLSALAVAIAGSVLAADVAQPIYNDDGSVQAPTDYRLWVFVGSPVTPNALNDGAASFPEFHSVYVEPGAFEHFSKTGEWANGTQIAKELTTVRKGDDCEDDGSCFEPSGQGYFNGEFSGLELTVKDTERFADQPGGWVYYSFGHHAPPYAESGQAFPAEACNACHEASAETDFVFTQFYPVITAAKP